SYSVPLTDIAKNEVELALSKNMVAVGVVAGLFGLDVQHIHRLLNESKLAKKGADILNKNLKAVDLGYKYVEEHVAERASLEVRASKLEGRIVLSGNHAVALGALVAGCRRYAGYPITPATDIMEFLADELPKVGGGVQRVGLAPTSLMDCFWVTVDAFNLSGEFQVPAIVLQDTVLAVRTESIPKPDLSKVNIVNRRTFAYKDETEGYDASSGPERYLRYQITPDGISPMAIPGTPGGAYVATGLEHTQAANTSSDARNHTAM